MTGAVLVRLEVPDDQGTRTALGWLGVSADFEGSTSSLTCDEFFGTLEMFLAPAGAALGEIGYEFADAADWIGDLGSIQTFCDDLSAIIGWLGEA